ncbi:MAG: hypothetical protein M3Z04_17430, partial [Chloroflexota bacterium]|nr:hypothetical protein [Chloroflexota bacterium]
FSQTLQTSTYGVAAADFPLANEVNTGSYTITATLDDTQAEQTILVDRYVLPKFAVQITTTQPYYTPGARVAGSVQSDYFFGKPTAGARIHLVGSVTEVQAQPSIELNGVADAEGRYAFAFNLPSYLVGSDLDAGTARFTLQAEVTDATAHSEKATLALPIATGPLVIDAVIDGGVVRPGLDNLLYVLSRAPDGTPRPAALTVTIDGIAQTVQTGDSGIGTIHFTPRPAYTLISIHARTANGSGADRAVTFNAAASNTLVIVRPDRAVYRVGETMTVTVLSTVAQPSAYLDIVREGQTVSTRAVALQAGRGTVAVDLPPDLYGTLTLHAYVVLPSGSIIRDTRFVVVAAANDLAVQMAATQATYRPGTQAGVEVRVRDAQGQGVPAAVGVAIVDESVFALAAADPGFAKLYFLLDQELLTPHIELHGFAVPALDRPAAGLGDTVTGAALATVAPPVVAYSLQANTYDDSLVRAQTARTDYFRLLSALCYALLFLLPLLALAINGVAAQREGRLGASLGLTGSVILLGLGILLGLLGLGAHGQLSLVLAQFPATVDQLLGVLLVDLQPITLLLAAVCLTAVLAHAWRAQDRPLALTGLLSAATLLPLFALNQTFDLAGWHLTQPLVVWGGLAAVLWPLALLLRSASLSLAGRRLGTLNSVLAAILIPAGLFILLGNSGPYGPLMGLRSGSRISQSTVPRAALGFSDRALALEQSMAAQAATPAAAMPATGRAGAAPDNASAQAAAPRVRQFFPETLLWLPNAATDPAGQLHLDVPLADSITTWRISALASTADGRLGSATASLRVFQDFFVDLDLPPALTVGDEVSVPVGVFNYLPTAQTVQLTLDPAAWFVSQDAATQEITIGPHDITVAYFRIQARTHGTGVLQVTAQGSTLSDAIRKEVQVYPNGQAAQSTAGGQLPLDTPISQTVTLPADAVPDTGRVTVKLYPGLLSQVVEGLDSILRLPSGCFEQSTSTTYPNVLVLDYLQTSGHAAPAVQLKAQEYISLGYQRLTTFEVPGGGFSLFGTAPADPLLTAYGLQEFQDMARVHPVDPALIARTRAWLRDTQQADGTWQRPPTFGETTLTGQQEALPITAYIVWSLVDSDAAGDSHIARGLAYLRQHVGPTTDSYALALVANALVAADRQAGGPPSAATQAILDRLAALAQSAGTGASWTTGGRTASGGYGETGSMETTALVALAFLRSNTHGDLASAGVTWLIAHKDAFGTWQSTSATVMALKALIASVPGSSSSGPLAATVQVQLDAEPPRSVGFTAQSGDLVQYVTFDRVAPGRSHRVTLRAAGSGRLLYQVTGEYYRPWPSRPVSAPESAPAAITVAYDRTRLAVNDLVTATVRVQLRAAGADQALIDLGVPPGFTPEAATLAALVTAESAAPTGQATIERYELTDRQVLIYVRYLAAGQALQFSYQLRARFPLRAQTPSSRIYDYYNPTVRAEAAPQELLVSR